MKGSDVFPSKYLRAADLDGREPIVTIDRVVTETLGDESKPVAYFIGKDKGLVMNKTNWNAIEEISGQEDSDHWRGTKLRLVTVKVEFQGKRVPAIRVEEPEPTKRPTQVRETAPPVTAPDADDIPFSWMLPLASLLPLGAFLA